MAAIYITKEDLEARFGAANIATWSNKDNITEVAVIPTIDLAIEYAEAKVENEFRLGRYTLPFTPLDPVMKRWMTIFAANDLYISRGIRDEEGSVLEPLEKLAMDEMFLYKSGQARLVSASSRTPHPTVPTSIPIGSQGTRRLRSGGSFLG